jgi:hypothetical protein
MSGRRKRGCNCRRESTDNERRNLRLAKVSISPLKTLGFQTLRSDLVQYAGLHEPELRTLTERARASDSTCFAGGTVVEEALTGETQTDRLTHITNLAKLQQGEDDFAILTMISTCGGGDGSAAPLHTQ